MMVVERTVPAGRLKKTWQNCVPEDLRLLGLNTRDTKDRARWRSENRRQPNTALSGKTAFNVGDDGFHGNTHMNKDW